MRHMDAMHAIVQSESTNCAPAWTTCIARIDVDATMDNLYSLHGQLLVEFYEILEGESVRLSEAARLRLPEVSLLVILNSRLSATTGAGVFGN